MTQPIAVREQQNEIVAQYERQAMETVAMATAWANQLMSIVEARKLYTIIADEKYLQFEAWQTIAAFDRAHFETDGSPKLLLDANGEAIGYEAKVNLVKDGHTIGAGVMSCGFDEFPCRGKEGMAKHKAAMSAAQTWAGSKAARMNYSYVAVLAGFQPTPAEEMTGESPATPKDNRYACPEHKGKLWTRRTNKEGAIWYSHRDGDGWCNMPEARGTPQEQGSTPVFKGSTLVDLWNYGLSLGFKNKRECLTALGIADDALVSDLQAAAEKLREAAGAGVR